MQIHHGLIAITAVTLAATATPAPAHAEVRGKKPYTLTISKVEASRGKTASANVVFVPAAGYHVNPDFPTSLKLRASPGVTASTIEMTEQDATLSAKDGRFTPTFTSNEAGTRTISGALSFVVCSGNDCEQELTVVRIEMDVR